MGKIYKFTWVKWQVLGIFSKTVRAHTHNHPQPSDGTEQNLVAALFCRLHRAVINVLYYKLKQSAAGDVKVRKCTHGGEPTGNESAN